MVERAPRTGMRVGALSGPTRWLVLGVFAAFAVLPIAAAVLAVHRGWEATGDSALIGLRSRDAWTSHAPLVGQPTTGDGLTGKPSNHPGPIEYWWLGITVRVLGAQLGMAVGAALVNGAALVGIAWLAFRRGGPDLLALTAAALAGMVLTLGAVSLWTPFNSELATYPMLLAVFAAWCVTIGDLRVLPVLAASATVAAQVHVAGAVFVAPLVLVTAVSLVLVGRRRPKALRRDAAYLLGAAAIVLVTWLPVLANELGSGPSNIGALWATATVDRPRIGLVFMLERLLAAVAPTPAFLHRAPFLADPSALQVLVAAAIIGGAGSLALHLRRAFPRSSAPWLVALVMLPMLTSTWMGSRQPPLSAFRPDAARWLWVVSLAVWVALAWCAWWTAPDRISARTGKAPLYVAAVIVALAAIGSLATFQLTDVRDGGLMPSVDELADATTAKLPKGTYHLQLEGDQALLTIGPALAYRLEADGFHVRVDDNAFGRGFGSQRTERAPGAPTIRVSSRDDATAAADEKVVATVPLDADDDGSGTITVFLRS
ncbi:hypothetical protein [Aquihabitans sp. McL0605]|uniref:hypothetical protein n=1 Tax=Aquihabitans sp. McL0605 TaxID=3415671 RepID=UPI003CECB252